MNDELKNGLAFLFIVHRSEFIVNVMDLSTSYMGLRLKNPLVPSASPLSQTLDGIRRMEDAGAAAVVMYSLFEEQINLESLSLSDHLDRGAHSTAEALSYFPEMRGYNVGPEDYLELVHA